MADESLLPGNLDLSTVPDAPKSQPPLAGLNMSSIHDALKPDENPGYTTESDPITNCIIDLRKSIFASSPPEPQAVIASTGISTLRDRDASPAQTSDSPEAGAIKNQPPYNTNTSRNIYPDTNVIDFNGKSDQVPSLDSHVSFLS